MNCDLFVNNMRGLAGKPARIACIDVRLIDAQTVILTACCPNRPDQRRAGMFQPHLVIVMACALAPTPTCPDKRCNTKLGVT